MMKAVLLRIPLLFLFCGCIAASNAQMGSPLLINPVPVGSIFINAGVGLGVPYKGNLGTPWGMKASVNWGVVRLGSGVISLGVAGGGSFSHGWTEGVSETANTVVILARGAWHYGWDVPGLDIYGGLSSGVAFHRFTYGSSIDRSSGSADLVPGIFVGATYFIARVFGFNAEVGDDITIIQGGIVIRIR